MKNKTNNGEYYPALLWLISLSIPAIIFGLIAIDANSTLLEAISIFFTVLPVAFFTAFILSFPFFLLLSFSYNRLICTPVSVIRIRLILIGIAISSMLLILLLLGNWLGFTSWGDLFLALPYAVCIITGGLLFKIRKMHQRSPYPHQGR